MDNVIKRIDIDFYSPTAYEIIKAQQGDNNSRIIEFVLYNHGKPYTISNNISATMEGHRGDNSSFAPKDCTVTNNIISVTLDSDVLCEAGTVEAKIVMYDTDSILSTIPFKIHVQKNPFDKSKIEKEKSSIMDWVISKINVLNGHIKNSSNPHNVTKMQVGLESVDNTSDMDKPVSTAQQSALDAAYLQATGYTDLKVSELINGAPSTLDTLKEIADAIEENQDVVEALDNAIGSKADKNEFESHISNNHIHVTSDEKEKLLDAKKIMDEYETLYQKKDVIDGFAYTIALNGSKIIIDEKQSYYIASEIRPGNKARLEINIKETATSNDLSIVMDWYVTDWRCMLVSMGGISIDEYLPVACQKKEGYYCFDIIDFLLRAEKYIAIYNYTNIYSIEITEENTKVIIESGTTPSTALGNIMKRIGTTPLGFGNGTLTGAMDYLYRELYQKKKGTLTTPLSGTNDRNKITRIGNIVMVEFRIYNTSFSGFNNVIANIPEEFRPSEEVNIVGYAHTAAGGQFACPYKIATNGNVTQWYSSAEFVQFGIFGTYII